MGCTSQGHEALRAENHRGQISVDFADFMLDTVTSAAALLGAQQHWASAFGLVVAMQSQAADADSVNTHGTEQILLSGWSRRGENCWKEPALRYRGGKGLCLASFMQLHSSPGPALQSRVRSVYRPPLIKACYVFSLHLVLHLCCHLIILAAN